MHILILGSGGREHTMAWKIKQSAQCENLFVAPGNAGTANIATNVDFGVNDFEKIKAFLIKERIEMLIIGPEVPLVNGLYDFIKADPLTNSVGIIGPSKEGAKLEGSKAFAKEFMAEFNIPTAAYKEFDLDHLEDGYQFIDQNKTPIVLKADGLAAGKGVLILDDKAEAKEELKKMLEGKFGAASSSVVIEEFLDGIEFSVFVLTDGNQYKILPVAKDYKRIGEGDKGLNTGGMGSISPVPFVDQILMNKVEERIVKPTIEGIASRGFKYTGFVFIGLIKVDNEPYVIEYNCRMGDPETQVVFPRIKNDMIHLLNSTLNGTLSSIQIEEDDRAASAVILVSGGYPEAYEKGKLIAGIEDIKEGIIFHAGTKMKEGEIQSNGGRVLASFAFGNNFQEALIQSYANADKISFEGKHFRKDIGFDL